MLDGRAEPLDEAVTVVVRVGLVVVVHVALRVTVADLVMVAVDVGLVVRV